MSTLATPVARRATDALSTRAARPRGAPRDFRSLTTDVSRLVETFEGLEPLFTYTREAAAVGNVDSGRLVLWNAAAERLLGWSAAQVIGRPIASVISPAIVPLHRAVIEMQRDGAASESVRPLDLLVARADGGQVHVELSLLPIANSAAPGRHVLMLLHADPEPRDSGAHARALSELESQLAATRQRLDALQSGVARLARDVHRACETVHHVQRRANAPELGRIAVSARVASRRLQQLACEVDALDGETPGDVDTRRVNLVPIVQQVVSRLRGERPRYRFNTALPQGLTATVNPRRLEVLVEILLERAMARCRGGCWIDVDLRRPFAGQARLEVRDFGNSVTSQDRGHLATGGRDDQALALAHSIAEMHGGTLDFEFPADGGVRAVVTLPTQRGRTLAGR
jgi:PAS domain S-box-containing protein